jgi:deoxyguanosine kinase
LVVYLHAPMEVILERIERRGRSFEKDMDRGYLEALVDAYGRFFNAYDDAPVLMIDTADLNFPASPKDLDVVLHTLMKFPNGTGRRHLIKGKPEQRQPSFI